MQNTTNQKLNDSETQTDSSNFLTIDDVDQYIQLKNYKPLSEKEKAKGKTYLRIYGTQDPMPWSKIYGQLALGQPLAELAYQYGHGRKIALWAREEGVVINTAQTELVQENVKVREKIQEIANESPEEAISLLDRVNTLTPNFQDNVAIFADKVVKTSITKLDNKYIEPSDIKQLADAVQKVTDTIGVTQRHAAGVNISNTKIAVTGFDFVLDPTIPDTKQELPTLTDDSDALEAVTDDEEL